MVFSRTGSPPDRPMRKSTLVNTTTVAAAASAVGATGVVRLLSCGLDTTADTLRRVTKSVLLSGAYLEFYSDDVARRNMTVSAGLGTDLDCRQTISGEHGLDSNGVYVPTAP